MKKKITTLTLCAMLLAISLPAVAQQPAKNPRVGELLFRPGPTLGAGRELFRRSLRELGYIEGKNIAFEIRSAEGKLDRFPALADELVRLQVDVLVASSADEAQAFRNATRTIPIVFLAQGDPVALGLVDSLARPGETSRASLPFRRSCPASDWSYSKKPYPSCRVLQCCGIHSLPLRPYGRKANWRRGNWVCSFIPWR